MWPEIILGLIAFQLFKWFFGGTDDDLLDAAGSSRDSIASALILVAKRIEKLFGGKTYIGLLIPDADTRSRQNIDIVLVTKGDAVVISVKNFTGFASIDRDGSWICEGEGRDRPERHPDPVVEVKNQTAVLASYLEQRGIALPEGYLSYKVIIPNPKFHAIHSNYFPPEVITYDEWVLLKPEPKSKLSGWIRGAFGTDKREMHESLNQKLDFVLSSSLAWDRLELKSNKYLLGEFLEFKGKDEDIQELRPIKRSKINKIVIQKMSMLGVAPTRLQVLYFTRDYGSEAASVSLSKEVTVRSSTEIVFKLKDSTKLGKFKLSSVTSLTLSA